MESKTISMIISYLKTEKDFDVKSRSIEEAVIETNASNEIKTFFNQIKKYHRLIKISS